MTDNRALHEAADVLSSDWLIVTDLDGTLLDHRTYSHAPVDATLQALEQRGVPVVFNTSKTFAELRQLRSELGNRHPFIVENGSAIYIPQNYFRARVGDARPHGEYDCLLLAQPVAAIHRWLAEIKGNLQADFVSFAEMSTEELAQATGLNRDQAAQAAQREFSEAIQWRDNEEKKALFQHAASAAGFKVLQGGRFLHLLGQCDKGHATLRLALEYNAQRGRKHAIVAAGDGPNDVDMLAAADLAIVVRSPAHDFPALPAGTRELRTSEYGPQGWAKVVDFLLSDQSAPNVGPSASK
jgi:mannosyl-3-phosphoglycerate phosphatase